MKSNTIYKAEDRLKVQRWRKIFYPNTNQKEAGIANFRQSRLQRKRNFEG